MANARVVVDREDIVRQIERNGFSEPVKKINLPHDMAAFENSLAYQRILWVLTSLSLQVSGQELPSEPQCETVKKIVALLGDLNKWVDEIPPKTGPRRFGNVAFRDWQDRLLGSGRSVVERHLGPDVLGKYYPDALVELVPYFLGAFGSRQRMDYGTGHEVSFVAFVGGLMMLGALDDMDGHDTLYLFESYLQLVRRLILTYSLEPAGSHGAWGLDDHSFVPYILGSAQLVDFKRECDIGGIATKSTADANSVKRQCGKNVYFSAIQFIYDVKRGPFYEHSPILYDISGVPYWTKVHRGLMKMYIAEVLGKFPVVQHFVFGTALFPLGV
jgi:serine/threonine-protein phosphatase 2A activator